MCLPRSAALALSFLLGSHGNAPLDRDRLPVKPVGDEHLVLLVVVAGGQDVGTLDGLVEVAEDIEDVDDTLLGIVRARGV